MGRWLVTSTPKSHLNPKKKKKSKKSAPNFFFFLAQFCYKNVEKMFYQPQKVTLSPLKVKKVKKVKKKKYFIFHILCKKKSHLYIYFFGFGPLTPSINKTPC